MTDAHKRRLKVLDSERGSSEIALSSRGSALPLDAATRKDLATILKVLSKTDPCQPPLDIKAPENRIAVNISTRSCA